MATLFVRTRAAGDGSKRYSVVYRRGGREALLEHAGTFKTRREALIRKEKVGDWLAAGLNPRVELRRREDDGPLLASVAESWLESRRGLSDGTRAGHRFRLPTILDGFPRMDVSEITVEDVDAWVGNLTAKYRPGTVRLFVQELRMILDHADLPTNPARSRRIEMPRDSTRTLEPPGVRQVLDAVGRVAEDLVVPLLTMEQLGTRVSETMLLKREDVEPVRARVRIRPEVAKTNQGRWVPAPDLLVDALMERLPFHGDRSRVGGALRRAKAGFSPHDLRHRRASLWSAQGVPPAQAAAWLGHTVDVYLRTYTHVIVDEEISAQDLSSLLR